MLVDSQRLVSSMALSPSPYSIESARSLHESPTLGLKINCTYRGAEPCEGVAVNVSVPGIEGVGVCVGVGVTVGELSEAATVTRMLHTAGKPTVYPKNEYVNVELTFG